jgi:UDP:flavonoid glycosyltransferase YjiC (YdhE family)
MARIVMAWELGGGMGHVVPLSQIAHPLVERGHEVHFVLRDLSGAAEALRGLARHPQVRLWQAPVWLAQLTGAPPPVSYAELLFHAGYLDARRMSGLAEAWRSLFDALQPQLLVADHAPTALLAARGRPMARALVGTGFFVPPNATPMPAFRDWERPDAARLAQSEARALATCNALLASWQQVPMDALHRLTEADEQFLLTWPELDHYSPDPAGRPGARYWGSLAARDQGSAAAWPPAGPEPTLFAYLKADYGPIEVVLQALQAAPMRTLAHVAGLRPELRRRFTSDRLRFSDGPVAMSQAMAGASAVLCHAGSGTVCTALQAGLPVLMLPMHAEQLLFARRLVDAGAGIAMVETSVAAQLPSALARLAQQPALRAAAQALAARQQPRQYGDVALQVALRCEALANGH